MVFGLLLLVALLSVPGLAGGPGPDPDSGVAS